MTLTTKESLPLHREYVPMLAVDRSTRDDFQYRSLLRISVAVGLFLLGIFIGGKSQSPLPDPTTHTSLLPLTLPPLPSTLTLPVPSLSPPLDPVPNIVHYVYGLDTESDEDFPYYAYLGMRSAMMVLKPDKIMFHCLREPRGYWWDRVIGWEGWTDDSGAKKGIVEVVKARDVQYVGEAKRPVYHYAHKADIIRLEVLLEHGGIYLDIDTFILRPFAPASLMSYDTVMGLEAAVDQDGAGDDSVDEARPKGLCNAIIVARQGATFIRRWLESYDSFDDNAWADHSVVMPWTLAKLYPTTITILSTRALFWPLWTRDHISAVYNRNEWDFEVSGQLAYHAWESMAKSHLRRLDPETVQSTNTSFSRMARRFREPDEEERWRSWRDRGRGRVALRS